MQRRTFLTNTAQLAVASPMMAASIASGIAVPGKAVKITAVKPYVLPHALYIKIETDAGVSGWGEADHEQPSLGGKFVTDVFRPVLIGQDSFDSGYLLGLIGNAAKVQEFSGIRPELKQARLSQNALVFADGFLTVPTGAELEVNETEMEKQKLNR